MKSWSDDTAPVRKKQAEAALAWLKRIAELRLVLPLEWIKLVSEPQQVSPLCSAQHPRGQEAAKVVSS